MAELLRILPIVFMVWTLVLVVYLSFSEMFRAPRFVRKARAKRAGKRLAAELSASAGPTDLVVYWDRYRHLSKFEIFAAVEQAGFLFVDQELNEHGWALNFTKA
ncbi:hypothetical protein LWC34_34590 [Kibdelosporangium philippinense]|uniref:Uncharacterized protein n=1 Tax=Kibdelosporangium philippinense TaxID=211113 RepID=A0ABS8ZJC5_9PSEU|nr:hypothetical protein [Kibdelosporangium philippinense]MCE7007913.1 hypothetical protein [Kibdelosporangium philippinense]